MGFRYLVLLIFAAFTCAAPPTFADIAAFNSAVAKGDYKAAAMEAAATWPGLDKSREDIGVIAQEFGFAACIAGDYGAALTYVEVTLAGLPETSSGRAIPMVLKRVAEHKTKPSPETRQRLMDALTARAPIPGLDYITFLGADALLTHDFQKGKWADAKQSARLAIQFADSGGSAFLLSKRRFGLYEIVSGYMVERGVAAYGQITELQAAVKADVDLAASDERAQPLIALYWEAQAWKESLDSHMQTKGLRGPSADKTPDPVGVDANSRVARLFGGRTDWKTCKPRPAGSLPPAYPSSALHKGFFGTVILKVDVDEAGKPFNPKILAAVPEAYFGQPVLDSVEKLRFEPGPVWNPAVCSLEEKGRVITYKFMIAR